MIVAAELHICLQANDKVSNGKCWLYCSVKSSPIYSTCTISTVYCYFLLKSSPTSQTIYIDCYRAWETKARPLPIEARNFFTTCFVTRQCAISVNDRYRAFSVLCRRRCCIYAVPESGCLGDIVVEVRASFDKYKKRLQPHLVCT